MMPAPRPNTLKKVLSCSWPIVLTTCFFLVAGGNIQAQVSEEQEADYQMIDRGLPAPEGESIDIEKTVNGIIERTNRFRKDNDLEPVQSDPELTKAASMLADFMARTHRYGHTADGRRPSGRAQAAGYRFCMVSENISYQYSSEGFEAEDLAKILTKGWKNSKGHRENMLGRYARETGVAVARSSRTGAYFAVQMFGRPRSASLSIRLVNRSGVKRRYQVALPDKPSSVRQFTLAPRAIRVHQRCRPAVVSFPDRDRKIEVDASQVLRLVDSEDQFEVKVDPKKKEEKAR